MHSLEFYEDSGSAPGHQGAGFRLPGVPFKRKLKNIVIKER